MRCSVWCDVMWCDVMWCGSRESQPHRRCIDYTSPVAYPIERRVDSESNMQRRHCTRIASIYTRSREREVIVKIWHLNRERDFAIIRHHRSINRTLHSGQLKAVIFFLSLYIGSEGRREKSIVNARHRAFLRLTRLPSLYNAFFVPRNRLQFRRQP